MEGQKNICGYICSLPFFWSIKFYFDSHVASFYKYYCSMCSFFDSLADLRDIKWEQRSVTQKSSNKFTSSYTACVHDIAIGKHFSSYTAFLEAT